MESIKLEFNDKRCVEIIKNGDLLAFPTDTIYGVGCVFNEKSAFDKLVALKKRPPQKPFTLMLKDKEEIEKYAYVDEKTKRIIDRFLPGELTLILKVKENLYPWVSLNATTIGIRVSGLKQVRDLIENVGNPLLVTSVNESLEPPLNDFLSIKRKFDGKIKGIVELNGYQNSQVASTIVIVINNELKLIRKGKIDFGDILKVWEEK